MQRVLFPIRFKPQSLLRAFARGPIRKTPNFNQQLKKNLPKTDIAKVQSEYSQEFIMDPESEEVTKEFISHMYLPPQSMPQQ